MAKLPGSHDLRSIKVNLLSLTADTLGNLRGALKELNADGGNESLHRMRVSIKKLRAIFRLCTFLEPNHFHYEMESRPYSILFKPAGQWRDLLNCEIKLMRYQAALDINIEAFIGLLRIEEIKCAKKYRKAAKHFSLDIIKHTEMKVQETLHTLSDDETAKTILSLLDIHLNESAALLSQDDNPLHLHEIRKILKNGWYIRLALPEMDSVPQLKPWGADMRVLIGHLGEFQDCVILQEAVSRLAKNRLAKTAVDRITLEKLNVRIFADKVKYIHKSVNAMEKVISLRN